MLLVDWGSLSGRVEAFIKRATGVTTTWQRNQYDIYDDISPQLV